jgi:hypothetical protein
MNGAHARALLAEQRVESAHAALVRSAGPLRAAFRRRPATWLLGGGFAAGLLAGFLPVHRWLRTGIVVASTGVRLLTPFLAAVEVHERAQQNNNQH